MLTDEPNSVDFEDSPSLMPRADRLPSRLRLLCVGPQQPSWVTLTLQLDREGCLEPQFRWVSTATEALTILRDESFDCVLASDAASRNVGKAPEFDLLVLSRVIRSSGCDDPLILITTQFDDESWTEAFGLECEILVTSNLWESRSLITAIKRAIRRVEMLRENHRLAIVNHRRLVRERDEAEHLLKQQQLIVAELETLADPSSAQSVDSTDSTNPESDERPRWEKLRLPDEIEAYYHELLRTYVIMGSGSLGNEIAGLADLIATAQLSPRDALQLHLERVESLVRGLGSRSTRHVMARADLLALELMIHLGENYQARCRKLAAE